MPPEDKNGSDLVHLRRNKELFNYLITTFKSLLPAEESDKFVRLATELNQAVADNCGACQAACQASCAASNTRIGQVSGPATFKDPRRQRFLLRLIAGRISHLFVGDKAILPRTVVEGMDRYLKKAMGEVIYDELNRESESLLDKVGTDNDREMWERIAANQDWRRFSDTILTRILLKFENFQTAKRIFMSVVGMAMNEGGKFQMKDGHFHILFEALFGELARDAENESKRILWDYQFGEETGKKLIVVFQRAKADRAPPKVAARR